MGALVLLLVVLLAAFGCSGAVSPAPTCERSQYDEEVAFDTALLEQSNRDGALCSEAPQIRTCLIADDSCEVCVPLRCCAEIEDWSTKTTPSTPALDACRATKCPVCATASAP